MKPGAARWLARARAAEVLQRLGPRMDHTATRCVFDPTGRLRLAVRHAQDAAAVAADITRLLKENP